jgi:hypothetical protein
MTRTNFEAEAIAPFEAVVHRLGLTVTKGQGAGNRLPVSGNAYFQFGDLRVDLPAAHVVLEVESAGGLTNLVKYWPCIANGLIRRPVHLLHIFRQASADDYRSHIELWAFLSAKMKSDLGSRFDCSLFTYPQATETALHAALQHFERLLGAGAA